MQPCAGIIRQYEPQRGEIRAFTPNTTDTFHRTLHDIYLQMPGIPAEMLSFYGVLPDLKYNSLRSLLQ